MPREQVATLLRAGLDLPRPKLRVGAVERRTLDARTIEWRHPTSGEWTRAPIWGADVFDGLETGDDYVGILARYATRFPDEKHTRFADELVRRQLLALHDAGVVDLGLADAAPPDLGARYRDATLLGRGGFGIAWRAIDATTGQQVVVKHAWAWYQPLSTADAVIRAEARVAAALDHPGIPRSIDTFERGGIMFLVRAFVDGAPLSREAKRTAPRDVLADAIAIADIVEHMHARGYLALDLGPSNFYRRSSPDERVIMIDVGLCHAHENGAAKLANLVGNRGYVSPEARRERVASVRSDVWSLGRLVLAFATRRPPKDKWNAAECAERVTDPALKRIVASFCADDPAARPATMRDARALLQETLARLPPAPRVVRAVEWRWTDKARTAVELFDEKLDRWSKYHPWVARVLEGLAVERSFDAIVDEVLAEDPTGKRTRAGADSMVRRFLFGLHQAGHVELDAPTPRATFAAGRYGVLRELGRGAVGVAYACADARSGETVVVKRPWGFFTTIAAAEQHVRHEGDVLRALDHPRIVRFVDAFEDEGRAHIARAFVDGAPHKLAPLDDDALASFARDVGDVLAHLHERGWLLVDLLPSNFLRTSAGPVLVDVGLARRHTGDTTSDARAFGRLLFTMATGVHVQKGWGEAELAARLGAHGWRERILSLARGDVVDVRQALG